MFNDNKKENISNSSIDVSSETIKNKNNFCAKEN